jgi:hypothetical protein
MQNARVHLIYQSHHAAMVESGDAAVGVYRTHNCGFSIHRLSSQRERRLVKSNQIR